ncbi:MAG: GntR family transcriptional regulator [Polaromonas sp.]|uniref:GntR family transcriptional regulator n=1 Tax=Polaromonas sp. TaxID=1869339 RepID=UPI002731FAE4|nr:GntR family transcriptional regulator [Polaromonas sp.]MDP2254717.1 GntR family transcriptional regulator [Polaromonas sp.]
MLDTEELDHPLSQSVIQRVSAQIEAKVLNRELEPGSKLNEQAMALQLGVSRGALREAIRFLEPTGLVEVIPNRGAFVRRISLEDVLHLYDLRAGISRTAGRLLTIRATGPQLQALFEMHEGMNAACEADDVDSYHDLNLRFHQALSEYTGNPRLQRLDAGIAKELALFMRRGVFTNASARRSCFEHGELLRAIKAGDSEGAAAAFEAHVLTGKQRMLDSISFSRTDG